MGPREEGIQDESTVGIRRLDRPPSATPGHWFAHRFRPIFHRNWIDVEVMVQDCTALRPWYGGSRGEAVAHLWGYAVNFTYTVDGRTIEGMTVSPDKMETGDRFVLRCNPIRPEQNNSFDSETSWAPAVSWVINIGLVLFFTMCFVWYRRGAY